MITHTLEFWSDQSDCPFVFVCGGGIWKYKYQRANLQLKGVKNENVKRDSSYWMQVLALVRALQVPVSGTSNSLILSEPKTPILTPGTFPPSFL